METHPTMAGCGVDSGGSEPDFGGFDHFVSDVSRWTEGLPDWPPAAGVRVEWQRIAPRLERARRELTRVLVVGVVGGTGTGKSTLVNALAGADVSPAGDISRPTTITPVAVAAPDVDLSWLAVEGVPIRTVRSDAPAVANIVLLDCPDPDTQGGDVAAAAAPGPPGDSKGNRDLLEAVLPACDVLLLVATMQKYRSWIVARELQAFAPGRPLFFVQTHAARDPDIRADWRRELEQQGFQVPRIFRVDGVEAADRAAAGLAPESGFRELTAAIEVELAGRAARRVRRTGALDLADLFLRQSLDQLAALRPPIARLAAGVAAERGRLEGLLARSLREQLWASRATWQRVVADDVVERWHGGPFAMFLHVLAALGSFWTRMRPGGLVGRLIAGRPPTERDADGWQAIGELGLSEADVEQSRSVLAGLATAARITVPLVDRVRLADDRLHAAASTIVVRSTQWLTSGLERLVDERRSRLGSRAVHWCFELCFSALLVTVLFRAGWSFFHGHMWLGRPVDGGGFLQEAMVWLILWGLVLRWGVRSLVRLGLDRDLSALLARLPESRLVDPLLADHAAAASEAQAYLDEGERLRRRAVPLIGGLAEPPIALGRFRGGSP